MKKHLNSYLVILILVMSSVSMAYAQGSYTFTTIDVPGSAGYTHATGINDSGAIVGDYFNAAWVYHGFLHVGGNFTTIDAPGAVYTWAIGINNSGETVGGYAVQSTPNIPHGFLDVKGSFTTIDVPGATGCWAYRINSLGDIVGYCSDATGNHGFLYVGGSFTTINVPGATNSYAYGINSSGDIVGPYQDATGSHGFLLDAGGNFTKFDFPSASDTGPFAINDSRTIVGSYKDGTGIHGFLKVGGNFTKIDFPGASITYATGINNLGDIVGWYQDATGTHGFLATPAVPPPVDTTPPTVTAFSIPSTSTSLIVPITAFKATDPDDVSLFYMVTESATAPLASDPNWSGTPPASYSFATPGAKTLYAWAKDAAGNVSTSKSASVTITLSSAGYTFTLIDFPGASSTGAHGINNYGAIVGSYTDPTASHGFLYVGGNFTTIDFPGSPGCCGYPETGATGINDSGAIVGYYTDVTGEYGFLYVGGNFTTIDPPCALTHASEPSGINNSGAIVGTCVAWHGFLDVGGNFTTIDFPGAPETSVSGINNSGAILGMWWDPSSGESHNFLDVGGIFTTIDAPGPPNAAWANGINDSGAIVGSYIDTKWHGFLDVGGIFTTIDVPGAFGTMASGINNCGAIVGSYTDATASHGSHGFLAIPTGTSWPTPSTPSNPSPSNGATVVSTSVSLSWSAASNADSYDVYFGTSSNPPYVGNTTSTSYALSGLSNNTTYYWKIVAKNNCGNSTAGPVWKFTVKEPLVISLSPTSGTVGTTVTIRGKYFGAIQGASTVSFNGTPVTTYGSWSDAIIKCTVPTGASTGSAMVTTAAGASNGKSFMVKPPTITSLSPTSGTVGTTVTIRGKYFGAIQGASIVSFNSTPVTTFTSWSDTTIKCSVPAGASTGPVVVTTTVGPSNEKNFAVKPPLITSLSPTSGTVGTTVTINGKYFGPTQGSSSVSFNGAPVTNYISWTSTSIKCIVPTGASTGPVVVTTTVGASNGKTFTVKP